MIELNKNKLGSYNITSKEKNMTVQSLRQSGYKVRVLHHRKHDDRVLGAVHPKGGETVVQITTPEGVDLEGRAKCSKKDSYNKKLGVKVAIGRALYKNCA